MNLNLPYLFYYLSFAFGMLFFMLVFMSKLEIRKLFWLGMLYGSGISFTFEHIYHFVGFTRYHYIEPFNFGYLSILEVASWTPATLLFIHFLPQREEKYIHWLYFFTWSAFTGFIAVIFENLGILEFVRVGPWLWFFVGFVFYYVLAKIYSFLEANRKGLCNHHNKSRQR